MTEELFVGVLTGTSVDSIDAALVAFDGQRPTVVATRSQAIVPPTLRAALLSLSMESARLVSVHEFGRLDVELATLFAQAVNGLIEDAGVARKNIAAIGMHGQTLVHRPGIETPYTLQLGDPNVIAAASGIDIVADFRRMDLACGGEGAPLAPALHRACFSHADVARAIVNIGGIANVTLLGAGRSALPALRGFDSGPGNGLMDAWIERHLMQPFDAGGEWAGTGHCCEPLLAHMLCDEYFARRPPKSTGRDYFNLEWIERTLQSVGVKPAPVDMQATLLALTACSIVDAIDTWGPETAEVYVCGGGAFNMRLMQALESRVAPRRLASTSALGIEPKAVEAVLFAWLARERLAHRPIDLTQVTGSRISTCLGAVYRAPRWPSRQ